VLKTALITALTLPMSNGDRWRLPDGREGLEVGRTRCLLSVLPLAPASPWPAAPELVWRATCTKLGARYLRGAVPTEPMEPMEPVQSFKPCEREHG
jgi:hypothetical protein